jgi:WD40 repeat protein
MHDPFGQTASDGRCLLQSVTAEPARDQQVARDWNAADKGVLIERVVVVMADPRASATGGLEPRNPRGEQRPGLTIPSQAPNSIAIASDGFTVAGGGNDAQILLWDLRSPAAPPVQLGRHRTYIHCVAFSADGQKLLTGSEDGVVKLWDVATGKELHRFQGHADNVTCVAFSADGGLMALEMAPGVIHLKDVVTGRTVAKLEDPHGDQASWISFTPDGTQLVVAARYAKAIHIWDLRAIRQRLSAMKLDWDWPEFPPATAASQVGGNVKGQIRSTDPQPPD